jgi:HEAT repeat protein
LTDPNVQFFETHLLRAGEVGTDNLVDALAGLLDKPEYARHRATVVSALILSRNARAVPVLIGVLGPDGKCDERLYQQVVSGLGMIGTAEALRELTARLEKDKDPARQACILSWLVKHGQGLDRACALVSDKTLPSHLRAAVVRSLGTPGLDAAVPTLEKLLAEGEVGNWASEALSRVGGQKSIDALASAMGQPRRNKPLLAMALRLTMDSRAMRPLLTALPICGDDGCQNIARALAGLVGERDLGELLGAIRQLKDEKSAKVACLALGGIPSAEAVQELKKAAKAGNMYAFRALVESDLATGHAAARELLAEDPDRICTGLFKHGCNWLKVTLPLIDLVEPTLRMAESKDKWQRGDAMFRLAHWKDPRAFDRAAEALLKDPEWQVRFRAPLVILPDPRAGDILAKAEKTEKNEHVLKRLKAMLPNLEQLAAGPPKGGQEPRYVPLVPVEPFPTPDKEQF